jgi:D-aminopeptidase
VGAGTGTIAFGFKGGIGTSSRVLPESRGGWTVGVLVQTNFGGVLQIDGAPIGVELGQYYMRSVIEETASNELETPDGSCMIVVATDAPIDAASLERLALRAFMGMARTGASGSNGSGDYVVAFSTHPGLRQGSRGGQRPRATPLATPLLSPLFMAAIEATEEAIYNSLFAATGATGPNGFVAALDIERTLAILRAHSGRD